MLAYGLANVANDFEIEQVLKRGWTSWEMPSVLQPAATLPWLGIAVAAAVMWLAYERSSTRPAAKNAPNAGRNATSGDSSVISA